jgi:hypothetical protein
MAVKSGTVIVKNATDDVSLLPQSSSLAHGKWDVQPSQSAILPGMLTAWTSQSDGFATGTQGTASFSLQFSDPQTSGIWSLRKELAILAKFLPAGFSAANGIRSLCPPGFTGSIKGVSSLFFNGKYSNQGISLNWDVPFWPWDTNSFGGTAPQPFTVSAQGGSGDNAVAILTIGNS